MTDNFQIRLGPERRSRWGAAAKSKHLPLSTWIKEVCDASATGGGPDPGVATVGKKSDNTKRP